MSVDRAGATRCIVGLGPWLVRASSSALAWTFFGALAFAAPLQEFDVARRVLDEDTLFAHLAVLTAPEMEGRDSPGLGSRRAAHYIGERFRDYGLLPWSALQSDVREPGEPEQYLFAFRRDFETPEADSCRLTLQLEGQETAFELGRDFVPVAGRTGSALGELVFGGFGIRSRREKYDDLKGRSWKNKVVLIVAGEPRHKKRFDGPELSESADLRQKLADLDDLDVAAVLVARRPPVRDLGRIEKQVEAALDGVEFYAPDQIGFRYELARWAVRGESNPRSGRGCPVLEVSMECASKLLGEDVAARAENIDRRLRPVKFEETGRQVFLDSVTETAPVDDHNVVAWLPGSDPELAKEFVVVGAHYDHIGVDARGRVAEGADDNASGTAAVLEVARACAASPPRRSILFCAFGGEEDGLLGARAFCDDPPVERGEIVTMLNMDMLGRGEDDAIAVIGLVRNPKLEDFVKQAKKLSRTGISDVTTRRGEELFQRSDHFAFHEIGVPALFFFEGLPISKNRDYHTWRDTLAALDLDKVFHSTRFVFNCTWLLANDDRRLPAPRD